MANSPEKIGGVLAGQAQGQYLARNRSALVR